MLLPGEGLPVGAGDAGAGLEYPQGAECGPGVDGGPGNVPCAAEESVTLKTNKNLKLFPQLMPIVNATMLFLLYLKISPRVFVQTVDAG